MKSIKKKTFKLRLHEISPYCVLHKYLLHSISASISRGDHRYTYRVLQTIQMKLILLCVWTEPAVLGSTQTALKFKYEI